MPRNGSRKSCPFTDEIVSYIYGELGGEAESGFEEHLLECSICTDEFAAAANDRFSVYEWKREIFDPMPTPEFVIPFMHPAVGQTSPVSFASAVKAWVQGFSLPLAVAAAITVCFGLGALILSYVGKREPPVTSSLQIPAVETRDVEVPRTVAVETAQKDPAPAVRPRSSTALRSARLTRSYGEVDKPAKTFAVDRAPIIQKAKVVPALNAYQEPDDDTLRLADLFDEVGG